MNGCNGGSLRMLTVLFVTAWLAIVAVEGYAEARAVGVG